METKIVKILAIDDNYSNLIVLNALLEEAFPQAELLSAQSGREGIRLCHEHRPDLILLDIVMPGMDGYAVCRTLKSDRFFKNIPIIMVTATPTDREGRIQAIEAGADGLLTKPLDSSELIAQVRIMLRIKEAEDRKLDEKERLEALVRERTEALLTELTERKKAEEKLQQSYLRLEESRQEALNLMRNLEIEIDEHKLTEKALKESEEHFQMLFENAPVGYQSLDFDGNFLSVNETWLDLLGYTREEVIGKWFGDFLAPGFKDAFRERFPLFKKWGSVHSEFEMVKKDGSIIYAAFDGKIGHTITGEFKQTHCVINDVTKQRIKEFELKQIYDFNNSLLNTIPFGMNIVDQHGTILFQNEIFKGYFGSKALGKKCRELHCDASYDFANCPLNKSPEIGESHLCEAVDILGGRTFDVSHIGMIYEGKKAMLEIFQDVTERKRAELIQKVLSSISSAVISTKDLDEFSVYIIKQLRLLLDTTNFRIVFYDEVTGICTTSYYADQRENVTSWPAEKSVTGYLIKENRSLLLTRVQIEELIRDGKVVAMGIPSEIWLGVPLRESGKVIGAFVLQNYEDANAFNMNDLELLEFISHQISIFIQRKKSLQDLMIALEKAEESDRLKTAFLSNMSHEIRTPMNGILGFSELLDDDNLSSEERRKFLDIINTNGQHLLSIINDILDIARIDSNQLVVNNSDFNLNQMLDEVWVSFENSKISMRKEHILLQLEKALGDDQCMISCDDVRLRQILYNLLGNSLKFTKDGHIKFGYHHLENRLQFYVQDTGKGISLENQELVFDRFRQEEETYTRQFGGTGLGLSISKKLAELLGGEMWLESEPGAGATFFFTIPYVPIPGIN